MVSPVSYSSRKFFLFLSARSSVCATSSPGKIEFFNHLMWYYEYARNLFFQEARQGCTKVLYGDVDIKHMLSPCCFPRNVSNNHLFSALSEARATRSLLQTDNPFSALVSASDKIITAITNCSQRFFKRERHDHHSPRFLESNTAPTCVLNTSIIKVSPVPYSSREFFF
jgi:hypothetical protein